MIATLITIPTIIDGLTQLRDFRESNNTLRFTTGLIAGLGFGIIVKAIKWFLIT